MKYFSLNQILLTNFLNKHGMNINDIHRQQIISALYYIVHCKNDRFSCNSIHLKSCKFSKKKSKNVNKCKCRIIKETINLAVYVVNAYGKHINIVED